MQIVRQPSHTLRSAWTLGGLAAVASGGAVLLGLHASPSTVIPPVIALLLFLAARLVASARRYVTGYCGERRTVAALRTLPGDYTAITNVTVPGRIHGDVDLLLVGPVGVLVVEIKTYRGTILYEDGAWWRVQSNGERMPIKNISAQARANARAVIARIQQARTHSSPLHGMFVPVAPVLVFAGPARLNLINADMPGLRPDEIGAYVSRLPRRLDGAQIAALVALFGRRCA